MGETLRIKILLKWKWVENKIGANYKWNALEKLCWELNSFGYCNKTYTYIYLFSFCDVTPNSFSSMLNENVISITIYTSYYLDYGLQSDSHL